MGVNLDSNTINKGMEIVKNISQMGANITKEQKQQPQPQKPDNFNQPHTQTVEVKVNEPNPGQKPMIIEKKPETHVHKVFPESRELNERECSVREMELKNEHEYKMRELDWRIRMEEENRRERKAREEYERQRREKDRKTARNIGICMVGAGVVAAGVAAYYLYSDPRGTARRRVALSAPQSVTPAPVPAEGTVE